MSEAELRELISDYGLKEDSEIVFHLCREVQRKTSHAYFRLIQTANNIASDQSLSATELDQFMWDKTHPRQQD